MSSAVLPSRFAIAGSAPRASRRPATSWSPVNAAVWSGVPPDWLRAFGSAPRSSSISTISASQDTGRDLALPSIERDQDRREPGLVPRIDKSPVPFEQPVHRGAVPALDRLEQLRHWLPPPS